MEMKNKLTVTEGRREGHNGRKKGKDGQGACIKDPRTKTMGAGELNVGSGGG